MGSLLSTLGLDDLFGNNNSGSTHGSGYNNILHCCDGVVDPLTLLAVLGSIVGLTLFLRQAIIEKVMAGRRRRDLPRSVTEKLHLGINAIQLENILIGKRHV